MLLVGAILGLHAWSLLRYPAPFVDEAWFASRAWSFLETGRPFGALDRGVFEWFEGAWTVFPYFPTWVQSLALRTSSAPELLPLRVVSLLFGLGLLAAVYRIGRRFGDSRLGLAAVTLTALSSPFLYSSHLARYDIMVAALGFGALAVYVERPSGSITSGVASGLLVGLAFETHPNGAVFGLPILALMWLDHRREVLHNRSAWGLAAGLFGSLGLYAAIHIFPYPQTFTGMSRLVYSATHTPPILTGDLPALGRSLADSVSSLAGAYHFLLPLVALAPLALLTRRKAGDLRLLTVVVSLVLMEVLLVRNKWPYYRILLSPALDLTTATLLLGFPGNQARALKLDWARRIFLAGILGAYAGLNLLPLQTNLTNQFNQVQARLKATIPPGDRLMASQTYWFGFHNHPYYSWENLVYYQRYYPGTSLAEAFREFQPDILIIDSQMENYILEQAGESLYSQYLRVSKAELEGFLARQAILQESFSGGSYGTLRVYRIDWSLARAATGRGIPTPSSIR